MTGRCHFDRQGALVLPDGHRIPASDQHDENYTWLEYLAGLYGTASTEVQGFVPRDG